MKHTVVNPYVDLRCFSVNYSQSAGIINKYVFLAIPVITSPYGNGRPINRPANLRGIPLPVLSLGPYPVSRTPRLRGYPNRLSAARTGSADRAGHFRPTCFSNTPGVRATSVYGFRHILRVDARNNRGRKSPCGVYGTRGRVGPASLLREDGSGNPFHAQASEPASRALCLCHGHGSSVRCALAPSLCQDCFHSRIFPSGWMFQGHHQSKST